MKYFTAEELRAAHRGHAQDILGQCAGKSVRDRFALQVFNSAHDAHFQDRSKTRILDLGPASGTFVRQLADEGYRELYATDIDDYRQPDFRPLFKAFAVRDLSVEPLPWPEDSFDMSSAWCVLPHLENPFHALREVHRVLQPQGLFIFTTPHLTSKPSMDYFFKNRDFKSYRPSNNHLVLFTAGVVKKSVLKYFNLLDIEYHARLGKIFRGPKGLLRQTIYRAASFHRPWQKALEARWAYNIVYILQKKSA